MVWKPKSIRITSNVHPMLWYEWEGREQQRGALKRRFTKVTVWRDDSPDPIVLTPEHASWDAFWEGPKQGQPGGLAPGEADAGRAYDPFKFFKLPQDAMDVDNIKYIGVF